MAIAGLSSNTHPAVVTVAPSTPLELRQVPTSEPQDTEVKIVVQWTASTPLDMHMALGHFLVNPPQILGDSVAGTVVAIGPNVRKFRVGDEVFGFVWKNEKQKAHQLFCIAPENHFGLVPSEVGMSMAAAVTVPDNFVTAWHTITADLGFDLPWPKPQDHVPAEERGGDWILIWGGGSSVAMYALQILKWYGYTNLAVVASAKHEKLLKQYGARVVFDYRHGNVTAQINKYQSHQLLANAQGFKYLFDCIGNLEGSVRPLTHIARPGSKVAILLPVVVKDAAKDVVPEYTFDVDQGLAWTNGVTATGVRTFFYMKNAFLAEKLQSDIMPAALRLGLIEPNRYTVVEGPSMLDRAQKAVIMLRDKQTSGMRLVWRVGDQEEVKRILD